MRTTLLAVRIGLLRHFPVAEKIPTGWWTASELQEWRKRYDAAETLVGEFNLGGISWATCLCSDLPRARITANAVFAGEIEHTELLREAEFADFRTGTLRLPIWVWRWLLRYLWLTGHDSQRVCRDDLRRRVALIAERLSTAEQDTLVVSHAGMMAYLGAELRRRGFAGPKLRIGKWATVYVYEARASK